MNAPEHGRLIVVSGPAGVGKTTICERLLKLPGFVASISATTRRSRPGERNGVDYIFMNREAFERARQEGTFLEWASVHDNYYGTPRAPIEEHLGRGRNVVLNIDVQGAAKLRESGFPLISFFLLPPSLADLRARITKRGDAPADIERRMQTAEREMARQNEYDHRIQNDSVERALAEIVSILERTRPV